MRNPPICVSIAESAAMLPDLSDFVPELDTLMTQYSRRVGPFRTVFQNGEDWYEFHGITDQRFIPPTVPSGLGAKELVDQYGATIDRYPGGIVIPEALITTEVPIYMRNRLKPDPEDATQLIPKTWAEWPASNYDNDYVDANNDWVIDSASGTNGYGINGDELSHLIGDGYVVMTWQQFMDTRPPEDEPV